MAFDIDDPEVIALAVTLAERDGVAVEEIVQRALSAFAEQDKAAPPEG